MTTHQMDTHAQILTYAYQSAGLAEKFNGKSFPIEMYSIQLINMRSKLSRSTLN